MVTPFLATNLYLSQQKHKIRKSIKHKIIAGIDKSELVFLTFSSTEIQEELEWKHSKEFKYKGNMYDVVDRLDKSDSTLFWLWPDVEEDKLNQQLESVLQIALGTNPDQNQKKKNVDSFYKNLFMQKMVAKAFISGKSNKKEKYKYLKHFSKHIIPPQVPPPDFNV